MFHIFGYGSSKNLFIPLTMRITTLILGFIVILLSSCGNQNNEKNNKNDHHRFDENNFDDSYKTYFLDFEQNVNNMKEDTFTINSIAKNITFIPLETSDTVLLYNDRIKIERNNDRYLISSSSFFSAFHSIMLFDSTGRFIDYLLQKGQGPYELSYISEWSFNRNTQLLVSSTSFQIILQKLEDKVSNKYTLDGYISDICLLNDGTIVGLPNMIGKGNTDTPYLHFFNQEGLIIHSFYYPQKRDIAYSIPEGRVPSHVEKYNLFQSYSGDVLFKDMFNDTIYRIRSMDDVKPYIILYKGSFTPTLKDIDNPTTGSQKVCLVHILDTQKYFFIRYTYRGDLYNSIWDKQTVTLMANTKFPTHLSRLQYFFNGMTKYRTPTGIEIFIQISSYCDGKLYCVLNAEQAMEFLPDIDELDNPVLMIIDI